jgi:hypothetical protein
MTTLVTLRTVHSDRSLTDEERRDQWRRQAGTLPPDGAKSPALQQIDGAADSDFDNWRGLVVAPQWPGRTQLGKSSERSHRRIVGAPHLRATA